MFIEIIMIRTLVMLLIANYYLILTISCIYFALSRNVKLVSSVLIALTQNHKFYFHTQYQAKIIVINELMNFSSNYVRV